MREPEKLTVDSVERHIKDIAEKDSETAHGYESWLYTEFIKGVAAELYSSNEAVEVANALLKTKELDFERWFA